jgi:FixJ family two-component response regulator
MPRSTPPESDVVPTVFIVDDDISVRESLEVLIRRAGLRPAAFKSAGDFLDHPPVSAPSCLILDVGLPDISGLDLQQQISKTYHPPIIFLTGYGDIPSSVRAIKAGALDFLTKPFSTGQLLRLVGAALAQDFEARAKRIELDSLRSRFQLLTSREREVLPLVVTGLLNKQAAAHLGISEITLQIHRTNVMRKMEAQSLAELVRMADALKISLPNLRRLPRGSVQFHLTTTVRANTLSDSAAVSEATNSGRPARV